MAAAIVATLTLSLSLSADPAAKKSFDLPAGEAAATLKLFAQQSGEQIVYPLEQVEGVKTNAVKGDLAPRAALEEMLAGSGLVIVQDEKSGAIAVKKDAVPNAGRAAQSPSDRPEAGSKVVSGKLSGTVVRAETLSPLAGATVTLEGTMLSATTAGDGTFVIDRVSADVHTLRITAPGRQPTSVENVSMPPNGKEVVLSYIKVARARASVDSGATVDASKMVGVIELDAFEVSGQKLRPYSGSNVDLVRTIDDALPYQIMTGEEIERSGAASLGDFIKQRLSADGTALLPGQSSYSTNARLGAAINPNTLGNVSSINLRGLGADKTLVLVNGRPLAGITVDSLGNNAAQPDLNGIQLNAIERIEILPSSASAIYGASAIGGVVNVILKKNYSGGEVRVSYANTFSEDAGARTVGVTYGRGFDGGKTQMMFNFQRSDGNEMTLRDRREVLDRAFSRILAADPLFFSTATVPFLSSPGNLVGTFASVANLPFFDGTTLGGRVTYIPVGTSPTTSLADLMAGLRANVGQTNTKFSESTQRYTGLNQRLGVAPTITTISGSVRHQLTPVLELFTEYTYALNESETVYNAFPSTIGLFPYADQTVAKTNPFSTLVTVAFPIDQDFTNQSRTSSTTATVGAVAKLPRGWTAAADYTFSLSRFNYSYIQADTTTLTNDARSGALNIMVDMNLYPLDLSKYLAPFAFGSETMRNSLALRAAGPLSILPWGNPLLAGGIEASMQTRPDAIQRQVFPNIASQTRTTTTFERNYETLNAHAELTLPLVRPQYFPLVHSLDLQVAGRGDHFRVDSGTVGYVEFPAGGGTPFFTGPTLAGARVDSRADYTSFNRTIGLKYMPTADFILRASLGSAFLPPTPSQLTDNTVVTAPTTTVLDPTRGGASSLVALVVGSNPDLDPQSSKSYNVGLVWAPTQKILKGLRLNAEYYRIEQSDAISTLGAQLIVNLESTYPNRVTRDASGVITQVDIRLINVFKRTTEGWDMSAQYRLKTPIGSFDFNATATRILLLQNQYSVTLPAFEAAGIPSEGGAAKNKGNASVVWNKSGWSAGWTSRYFGDYLQFGSAGGPYASQTPTGSLRNYFILRQGGNRIPSQIYHDAFVGYRFGPALNAEGTRPLLRKTRALLDDVTIQAGVKNVFDDVPPFDFFYEHNYYTSPYGDLRGRSYWITLKKAF